MKTTRWLIALPLALPLLAAPAMAQSVSTTTTQQTTTYPVPQPGTLATERTTRNADPVTGAQTITHETTYNHGDGTTTTQTKRTVTAPSTVIVR